MEIHHHNHHDSITGTGYDIVIVSILVAAMLAYPLAAYFTSKTYKNWPLYRYVFWILGVVTAGAALVGPLAELAHSSFTAHMFGHLLLGMLSPLLLVISAPVKLLLRTLNTTNARILSRLLKGRYIQFVSNPIVAATLNIGGLAVLYTTGLYNAMHDSLLLHVLVHLHVFLAGYLFTASIIYMDVSPHRYSYVYRALVLILALAGHKILSKHIYAYPPEGVARADAETGGMLMYYGGDMVDVVIIIILCYHWYKATAPRRVSPPDTGAALPAE